MSQTLDQPTGQSLYSNLQQRLRGRNAWIHSTPQWTQFVEDSTSNFRQLPSSNAAECIDSMHQQLQPIYHHHFAKASHKIQAMHTFNRKWELKRLLQHFDTKLSGTFQAWKTWTMLRQECRRQDQLARQRREAQAQAIIDEAQHAADTHDVFTLYSIINKYSPKQSRKPIALKQEGHLLTPSEAHQHLVDFVKHNWTGPGDHWCTIKQAPGVPFTQEELENALSKAPPCKATAPTCVRGVVLRPTPER